MCPVTTSNALSADFCLAERAPIGTVAEVVVVPKHLLEVRLLSLFHVDEKTRKNGSIAARIQGFCRLKTQFNEKFQIMGKFGDQGQDLLRNRYTSVTGRFQECEKGKHFLGEESLVACYAYIY